MKSNASIRKPDDFTSFPMLGVSKETGAIVLFTAMGTEAGIGTCVFAGKQDLLGEHSVDWDMSLFVPYIGQVTLKN